MTMIVTVTFNKENDDGNSDTRLFQNQAHFNYYLGETPPHCWPDKAIDIDTLTEIPVMWVK